MKSSIDTAPTVTICGSNLNRHYRLRHYRYRNGDNYPTHDLGPIAKLLNINRGNRMLYLTSMSSKSAGLREYINARSDTVDPAVKNLTFSQGDIVSTMIKCAGGETITLSLDTTLPRFCSRNHEQAYLPKIWKDITPEDIEKGHGGMDTLEFHAFYTALGRGMPMPADVYDAAS